jgi:hypothetical protein
VKKYRLDRLDRLDLSRVWIVWKVRNGTGMSKTGLQSLTGSGPAGTLAAELQQALVLTGMGRGIYAG